MVECLDCFEFCRRKSVLHRGRLADSVGYIPPAILRQKIDRPGRRPLELVIPMALHSNRWALQIGHQRFQTAVIVIQGSSGECLLFSARLRQLLDELLHKAQNTHVGIHERNGQIRLGVEFFPRQDGIARQRSQARQRRAARRGLKGQAAGAQRSRGKIGHPRRILAVSQIQLGQLLRPQFHIHFHIPF